MKSSMYMTRALRARDPRFARVLGKLGHAPIGPVVDAEDGEDIMKVLRAGYARLAGKKAYHGWDEARLRAKIAALLPPAPVVVLEPVIEIEPVISDETEGD
jgi:hypothetical protein